MSTVQDAPLTDAAPVEASPGGPGPTPHRFTSAAFRKMIEADVFADDDRVELWDGLILDKVAKNKPHYLGANKVNFILGRVIPPGWVVGNKNPIELGQVQVPLPDLVLLRGTFDDYLDRDPAAADVGLVVELADSSLRYDTTTKLGGYAAAAVPVYWVVNLVKNVIQAYEGPVPAERRYAQSAEYRVGQSVPLRLDGVLVAEIPALDLLPVRA